MTFLEKSELNTVSTQEVINLITNSDNKIIDNIIAESIDLMKSYLFDVFDAEAIFSQTGTNRSLVILKYLKDIVIHEIYIRRSKVFNEVAQARYNEAMLWLEKIAKGELTPNLPKKVDANSNTQESSYLKLGSNPKYSNHW